MKPLMQPEQQVGVARARRPRRMERRERNVLACSAVAFVAAAALIAAFVESDRTSDPLLALGLVAGYALVSRVRFEFGNGYVVPEQLVFVPMLLLSPLEYVPLLAASAGMLAMVPDFVEGTFHRDRWFSNLADSWFAVGPVLVLAALAPGEPTIHLVPVYLLAFASQVGGDLLWSLLRDKLVDGLRVVDSVDQLARCGASRRGALADRLHRHAGGRRRAGGAARPGTARLAARHLLPRAPGAVRERARAPPRLPGHGHAAVGRGRVRRSLHGSAQPLDRRPGARDGRRARNQAGAPSGDRIRRAAPRRRQDRHSQGDPEQAGGPHRRGVRGHEDAHDRGAVHARSGWRPPGSGRRGGALVPRALGRDRLSGWTARRGDPLRVAPGLRLRRLQRHDHRPRLSRGPQPRRGDRRATRAVRERSSTPASSTR